MSLICSQCGRDFVRPALRGPTPTSCSAACRQAKYRSNHMEQSKFDPTRAAESFAQVSEACSIMLETVTGYREKCIAHGFSPTAAEAMAEQLHTILLTAAFGMKR